MFADQKAGADKEKGYSPADYLFKQIKTKSTGAAIQRVSMNGYHADGHKQLCHIYGIVIFCIHHIIVEISMVIVLV